MWVFFVAFLISFALTPLMRMLALRTDVVDHPGDERKIHTTPTPYLGGVAILLGWMAGIGISQLIPSHFSGVVSFSIGVAFPITVVLGAVVITMTGLFDDVYGISPRVKIGGQLFAAAALASQDVGVRLAGRVLFAFQNVLTNLPLPTWLADIIVSPLPEPVIYVLGTFVIAFFVIGGCNALNLIDGMDGLASGVTAIAAAGFLLIAGILAVRSYQSVVGDGPMINLVLLSNDAVRMVMCMAILGAVLGFLPYNFNPATIFMGDAGSLLLGYLSAATMLMFSLTDDTHALLAVTAGLIVFALPITDTSLAIFRRKMQGMSMSTPDARHLHHLLRRSGLSVRQSVTVMYGVATLFAALGVALIALEFRWRYILAVAMVLYGFIFVTAYKIGLRYSAQVKAPSSADVKKQRLSQNPQSPVSPVDENDDVDVKDTPGSL